jgi:hypothetical protein
LGAMKVSLSNGGQIKTHSRDSGGGSWVKPNHYGSCNNPVPGTWIVNWPFFLVTFFIALNDLVWSRISGYPKFSINKNEVLKFQKPPNQRQSFFIQILQLSC